MDTLANLSPADRARMLAIGPVWGSAIQKHRDVVLDIYTPLLAKGPKDGIRVTRNLAYGAHKRQVLDVFRPEGRSGLPVAVFVHGGAFIRGDKSVNGEIYDNVLYYLARHGILGVNIEYRLANEAPYPGGAVDLHAAIQWVKAHAAGHGGDSSRVFVIGHSAGASHVGNWAWDPAIAEKPGDETRGLVFISGRMRADVQPENPNAPGVRAYYGDDEGDYDARSPVTWAEAGTKPVMIAIAEFENPLLDVYGAELLWRVSRGLGRSPRFLRLAGHNHTSMVAHLNSGEETLGPELLEFIGGNR